MVVQVVKRYYSPEEYLALEAEADFRSEYRDGEIVPMAGGTTNHNEIITNLCVVLKPPLRAKRYRLFTENVRVWIERYRIYTYPDVMVIAGEPIYYGSGTTTVVNPSLIVEVASKSTKNYDQGDKFDYYRSLSSFREYVLVEQDRWRVVQHLKTSSGQWLLTDYETQDAVIELASLNLTVPLSDIYAEVDFGLSETDTDPIAENPS